MAPYKNILIIQYHYIIIMRNSQNTSKKTWTIEEDNILMQVVHAHGPGKYGNW